MEKLGEDKPEKRKRSSSSSSSSDSEKEKKKRKKQYKKDKKKIKKKMKKLKKKLKRKEKEVIRDKEEQLEVIKKNKAEADGETQPEDKTEPRSMAPMTKEEWEKRQSVVRRVLDESTGRYRLIKGDGEVIEEIVSRDRHREINKQATRGDGNYFQSFFNK